MKWSAVVPDDSSEVRQVVVEPCGSGVFLYLYDHRDQSSRAGEEWYESLAGAKEVCRRRYGIAVDAWSSAE